MVKKRRKIKKPLNMKGVMKLMTTSSEVSAISVSIPDPKITKAEFLNSQIEKFFASGKTITKVTKEHRAMPEFVWWKQQYPKNWRQRYRK